MPWSRTDGYGSADNDVDAKIKTLENEQGRNVN